MESLVGKRKKRCANNELTYVLHGGNEFRAGGNILFSAA